MVSKPTTDHYSFKVLEKARDLVRRGGVGRSSEESWHVVGTAEGIYTVHVVQLDGEVLLTCNCPNGQSLGDRARCYHTAAVALQWRGDAYPENVS